MRNQVDKQTKNQKCTITTGFTERKPEAPRWLLWWISVCMILGLICSGSGEAYAKKEKANTTLHGKTIRVPQDKQSIQVAIDVAHNGDTVLVYPGIYHEAITLDRKNITLASQFLETGDEKDIIQTILDGTVTQEDGSNKKGSFVIKIGEHNCPDLRVIGFTIQNGDDGIMCSGETQILHNRFINNNDAIDYESGGGLCQFNVFENNKDDAVDLDGASEAVIADNVIRNNKDDGIEIRLHEYSGPVLNIAIRNNVISGNGEDGIQIIDYPDISDRSIHIERNLIVSNAMAAIGCMSNGNTKENYEGADIPERIYLINNTIADCEYGITGGDNLVALNNILIGVRKSALKKVDGESIAAHNLFWQNGTDIEQSNVDDASVFCKNPLLDEDFRLRRESPCIDAGIARFKRGTRISLQLPSDTYSGSAPDLGAFEFASTDLGRQDAKIWEYREWILGNSSYSGNPFDIVATVTFLHRDSHRQITTEMFYAGNDQWKFRFTGTAVGTWDFTTSSVAPDLDGYTGTVNVNRQTDPRIKGFLTHVGNQFAIMDHDDQNLRGYVYQVYMNQQDFAQQHHQDQPRPLDDTSRVDDYWEDTQRAGFDIYFVFVAYSWLKLGALYSSDRNGNENPDLQTFDNLEYIINYAHSRGGRTHIWAWGDNGRKQTPNHLPGGVRGKVHKRLLRYIAARLGPLPGWAMNFGFDTIEMPNAEADTEWWADYLNQHLGWKHLLCSRGWESKAFGINSYAGFTNAGYELVTTDKGPEDYGEIVEDLDSHRNRPLLYEERHTYNRWVNWPNRVPDSDRLNMDGTRRLLWREVMAGGAGGFFGYFSNWFNRYGPFEGYYPYLEQLRCARAFWRDRYMLGMERANHLIDKGYCLRTPDNRNFVFYAEDTSSIVYDISEITGSERVIAVDVRKEYEEINLGAKSPGRYTYNPDYISDWAIAVGNFHMSDFE